MLLTNWLKSIVNRCRSSRTHQRRSLWRRQHVSHRQRRYQSQSVNIVELLEDRTLLTSLFSIDDVSISESDSGTSNVVFTVTRSGNSAGDLNSIATVNFSTQDGTAALADADYIAQSGTLVFTADPTGLTQTQIITVSVNGDTLTETDETFQLLLLNSSPGTTIADDTGIATIVNNDSVSLSISDATALENEPFTFNVSLSEVAGADISFRVTTQTGTADHSDYTFLNNQLVTIKAGDLSTSVTIYVHDDNTQESDETFSVVISDPQLDGMTLPGALTVSDATGTGTIVNDDAVPGSVFSIEDTYFSEGDDGTLNMVVRVTRTGASPGDLNFATTVDYTTIDGTAIAGEDYTAKTGTLSFSASATATSQSKNILISISGDFYKELTETFNVRLSNPTGGSVLKGNVPSLDGTAYILNDDTDFAFQEQLLADPLYANHTYDRYGSQIAIDGNVMVVGAPDNSANGDNEGAVYIYVRNQQGTPLDESDDTWEYETALLPEIPPSTGGQYATRFGSSVAIEGDTIVVGAESAYVDTTNRGLVFIYTRSGSDWKTVAPLVETLDVSGTYNTSYFGSAVSIYQDTIVVGARSDHSVVSAGGAAYIFEKNGLDWSTPDIRQLTSSDLDQNDFFGAAVSIQDNLIVVGAPKDNTSSVDSGSAYVFTKNGADWITNAPVEAKLTASDASSYDYFGYSVTTNGVDVAVGAHQTDDFGYGTGSAYLYSPNGSDWTTLAPTEIEFTGQAQDDYFGSSVALGSDRLVVGSIGGGDHGTVHVFSQSNSVWDPGTVNESILTITSNQTQHENLGDAVAISGDTIVAGAPNIDFDGAGSGAAYVFQDTGAENWIQRSEVGPDQVTTAHNAGDAIGKDIVIKGNYMLITAPGTDSSLASDGVVYLYQRNDAGTAADNTDDTWDFLTSLTAPNPVQTHSFGDQIAIDGEVILISATLDNNTSEVYLYEKNGSDWTTIAPTVTALLSSVFRNLSPDSTIAIDGDTIVVGNQSATGNSVLSGAVYVYTKNGADWSTLPPSESILFASDGAAGDQFGISVAIDGETILIGASEHAGRGAAYLYQRGITGWDTAIETRLIGYDISLNDKFGTTVAIDGNTVAISAPEYDGASTNVGAVYLFDGSAGWDQPNVTRFSRTTGNGYDNFGNTLSLDGQTLVVGTHYSKRVAYIYDNVSNWNPLNETKISYSTSSPLYGSGFGSTVTIQGNNFVAGVVGNESTTTSKVYSYNQQTPSFSIDDASITESDNGSQTLNLTVSVSDIPDGIYNQPISIDFATVDGTATAADNDYQPLSGTLYFDEDSPLATQTQTISILINGDTKVELAESFSVILSNPSVASDFSEGTAVVTINDNDTALLSISDVSVNEDAGTATVTVSFNQPLPGNATVDYTTSAGSALAGTDYLATSGTLNFTAGQQTQTITVDIPDDDLVELDETFDVALSNLQSAGFLTSILDGSGTVTIEDDDQQYELEFKSKIHAVGTIHEGDHLGNEIAVDGDTMISGAPFWNDSVENQGGAFVYVRNQQGTSDDLSDDTWDYQATLLAPDAAYFDRFGWSVAISGDTAVVSAVTGQEGVPNSGSVYVFTRTGTTWSFQQELTASDAVTDDFFGQVVAIEGDTIVVGSLRNNAYTGAAYVFQRSNGVWSETTKLIPSDATTGQQFGSSIDIEGATIVIGSYRDSETFGQSGAVYIFRQFAGNWTETQKLKASTPTLNALFGTSLSIEGENLIIGNPGTFVSAVNSGKAILFTFDSSTGLWSESQTLIPTDGSESAYFGRQVRIQDNLIAIGTLRDPDTAVSNGVVYTFVKQGANWVQDQKLISPDAVEGDTFGKAIGITNGSLLVSSYYDDDGLDNTGSIYHFGPKPPAITISDAVFTEGDNGSRFINIEVTRTASHAGDLLLPATVDFTTLDGTATVAGGEYQTSSGTLNFSSDPTALTQTETISIEIFGDTLVELDKAFSVVLSNATGPGRIEDDTADITITDDDQAQISIADVTVNEDAGTVTLTASLDQPVAATVMVNFATADNSATKTADYVEASGVLNFNPYELTKTFTISITDTNLVELDETFLVNLANIQSGTADVIFSDNLAYVTITDDDQAAISISDLTVDENDGTATLTVSLDNPVDTSISVDYTTADGSATSSSSDYQSTTGTLTFNPLETSKTITVSINDENLVELDETFFVNLLNLQSNDANVVLTDNQGSITIRNNDQASVSINDISVDEDAGTAMLTVSLSHPVATTVSLDFATLDGTALNNSDYTPTTGTVTFNPGETTKTINLTIINDDLYEQSESFFVQLSNLEQNGFNVDFAVDQAEVTILSNDFPTLSINDVEVDEDAGMATLTVSLDQPVDTIVSVDYSTANLSAISSLHYVATSGTISFDPGEQSRTISISIIDSDWVELDGRFFFVNLANIQANGNDVIFADDQARVTIREDDQAVITVDDIIVDEDVGLATLTFSVSNPVKADIFLNYSMTEQTAVADQDYVNRSGVFVITWGKQTQKLGFPIIDSDLVENPESYLINLTGIDANGRNVVIGDNQAQITILDDDQASLSVNDVIVNEAAGTATLTVSLDKPVDTAVTVDYSTIGQSATAPGDYLNQTGTLTFNPGSVYQTIVIDLVDSATVELPETFDVQLSNLHSGGLNVVLADNLGTVTIQDDDLGDLELKSKLHAEGTPGINDNFGYDVAVDGDTLISSALFWNETYSSQGGVFIYVRNDQGTPEYTGDDTWDYQATLLAPDADSTPDRFGWSVAISGDTAVVGAQFGDGTTDNIGALYVYTRSNGIWSFQQKLIVSDTTNGGFFGEIVTIEGDTIVASSYSIDSYTGAAFVFQRVNGFWSETAKLTSDSPQEQAFFGSSIAIENSTIVIGSRRETDTLSASGAVYIFRETEGNWTLAQKLNDSLPASNGEFGGSVSLEGNLLLVGAPALSGHNSAQSAGKAILYELDPESGLWAPIQSLVASDAALNTFFGTNVKIHNRHIYISSLSDPTVEIENGAVYVFKEEGQDWVEQQKISSPDAEAYDRFARRFTISDDTLFLGAYRDNQGVENAGSVYVYGLPQNPPISIENVTITEEDDGSRLITATVTRTATKAGDLIYAATVDFQTADGSATVADGDYQSTSGTLTFNSDPAASSQSQTISVRIYGDTVFEADETFSIELLNATGHAHILNPSSTVTILNNDPAFISINDSIVDEDAGTVTVNVSLSDPVDTTVTVDFATADQSATSSTDYNQTTGTITFNPGVQSQTIVIPITDSESVEYDETFLVNLSGIQAGGRNVIFADDQAQVTIHEIDQAAISIDDVAVDEDAGIATLTVSLDRIVYTDVFFDFTMTDQTAVDLLDYENSSGLLPIIAGQQTQILEIPIIDSDLVENEESFFVNLSGIQADGFDVVFADDQAEVTIHDNDQAQLSIGDVTVNEDAGTVTLTVSLDQPVATTVLVDYATADNSAIETDDYVGASGTLSFSPGELTKTFTISITDTNLVELDETFLVNLANIQSGTADVIFSDNLAYVTITDDDQAAISITDITVDENDGTASLTVSLDNPVDTSISVDYTTADGSATSSSSDYQSTTGTLTFNPLETSKTITVSINDENLVELDETFFVNLLNLQSNDANVVLTDNQGSITIRNNDQASLTIADTSVDEAVGTVTLTVSLDQPVETTISVGYSTADQSATETEDYMSVSGTLTFNPGDQTKTFTVPLIYSGLVEPDESFLVNLTGLQNNGFDVVLDDSQAVVTIIDRPPNSVFNIEATSFLEGNDGTKNIYFRITRTGENAGDLNFATTIDFTTVDGTAIAGEDYTSLSRTLTFSASPTATSQYSNVLFSVNGDQYHELTETIIGRLTNPTAGSTLKGDVPVLEGELLLLNDDTEYIHMGTHYADPLYADHTYDRVGSQIAIDGDVMVVGVPENSASGNAAGAVYIYVRNDQETPLDNTDDTWEFETFFLPTFPQAGGAYLGSAFGSSVAIDGDTIVVGAERTLDGSPYAGAVYVYTKVGDDWKTEAPLVETLTVTGIPDSASLGNSVSIFENTIVAGAYNDRSAASSAGAAYIFEKTGGNWSAPQIQQLLPADLAQGDKFGTSVSIYGDLIVVGSQHDDDYGSSSGSAYVFTKNGADWTTLAPTEAKLTPSDGSAGQYFGRKVATNGVDVAVSAYNNLYGAVYLYSRNGADWSTIAPDESQFTNNDMGNDFGKSIALTTDQLVVGEFGAAYVYTKSGLDWDVNTVSEAVLTKSTTETSGLGSGVAISGKTIAAGAPKLSLDGYDSGAVFMFEETGTDVWTFTTEINPTLEETAHNVGDVFGDSIVIDDNYMLVTAPGFVSDPDAISVVYVYARNDGGTPADENDDTWIYETSFTAPEPESTYRFGESVTIQGTTILVSATLNNGTSEVYIYERNGSDWTTIAPTITPLLDRASRVLHQELIVALDDQTIAIGSPNGNGNASESGVVYVYTRNGADWSSSIPLESTIIASDGAAGDNFGTSLDIDTDKLIIGASGNDNRGAAYLFEKGITGWDSAIETKITGSDSATGDKFGASVEIEGHSIAIAAPEYDAAGAINTGAVYLYDGSAGWNNLVETKFSRTDGINSYYYYGTDIDLDGTTLAIGTTKWTGYLYDGSNGWNPLNETVFPASSSLYPYPIGLGGSVAVQGNNLVFGVLYYPTTQSSSVYSLNKQVPLFSVEDATIVENNNGTQSLLLTVTANGILPGNYETPLTVDFTTVDGTATALDNDYQPVSGTLTFDNHAASTSQTQTITIPIIGDTKVEVDETFSVVLSNPSVEANLSQGTSLVTIDDNDQASISITDTIVDENAGTATLTVALDQPVTTIIAVDYATANQSATSPNDFQSTSGTLTFNPGDLFRTITVPLVDSEMVELDETFLVNLFNIQSSTADVVFADSQAQVTIHDDDQAAFSIGDITVDENAGTATLTVSLDQPVDATISVDYTTADQTAVQPDDYSSTSGTLTFNPGELTQSITIAISDSELVEIDETFLVNLANIQSSTADVVFADSQAQVTIQDDDQAAFSIDDITVDENTGTATLTVSLDEPVDATISVDYTTADQTAVQPDDYSSTSGTLTFNPGELTQSITIAISDSELVEIDETFLVNLANIQASTADVVFADSQAQVTIQDDDQAAFSIDDITVDENAGTTTLTVSLDQPVDATISVDYTTADQTAVQPDDYSSTSGTLTFNPGELTQTIIISIINSNRVEIDETFLVNLFNIQSSTADVVFTDSQAQVTILDDDQAALSINDVTVNEDVGTAMVTVSLDSPVDAPVSIDYSTADQTAVSTADYSSTTGTVIFNPGDQLKTISVSITDSDLLELDETFLVNLFNLQADGRNVILSDSQAEVTILDDEIATAEINVRVVNSPTITQPNGELAALPESQNWVSEWSSYWVEIWIDATNPINRGIVTASLDFNYNTEYTSATEFEFGNAFTQNQAGTINDLTGTVAGLSAETNASGLGVENQVLFARIKFESLTGDQVSLDLPGRSIGPYDLGLDVSSPQVSLEGDITTAASPGSDNGASIFANPFDLNDDDTINIRDLVLFINVYRSVPSESSSDYAWFADFDKNDHVNIRDLIQLINNYGKSKQGNSAVSYPDNYPDAWNQLLTLDTIIEPPSTPPQSLTQSTAETALESVVNQISPALAPSESQTLEYIDIQVVDLKDDTLGRAAAGTIYIDVNAAGYGWFADTTPADHNEFAWSSELTLIALPDSKARGLVDLRTVILHELGHILGYEHENEGAMQDRLAPGVRHLSTWDNDLDSFFTTVQDDSEMLFF
ncbi:Calx-beta domain-containing protein [Gimesia fumaroli]|uniref:Calx-beta domain protein n=1 Tax=Gimesia fumaroli TaxID=2527976 RepID=A0A518IAG5_9PLAN|nr:Calx-beta domain-containing protein [Gimesia fumaroli]QDV50075.1 Calx-beta domain protein [Gimesia fumaroli]